MNAGRDRATPLPEQAFVEQAVQALRPYLSEANSRAAMAASAVAAKVEVTQLRPCHVGVMAAVIERSLELFNVSRPLRAECLEKLRAVARGALSAAEREVTVAVAREEDLFRARAAAKELCARVGLGAVAMTKVVTALSELGRNILKYAGAGSLTIRVLSHPAPGVEVVAADSGPGIADLARTLDPRFQSRTGMGVGLRGTRNVMDFFDVQTSPARGTTVTIRKLIAAWQRPAS